MKRDQPFEPSIKSGPPPEGLIFRLARREDCIFISDLLSERNPSLDIADILASTNREIDRVEADGSYKLYVVELNSELIGFCRFYHTEGLPERKKVYLSPEGWYGMGILVSPKFRRQNIARFLSTKRTEVLKRLGVKELYSMVDSDNLASMKMHQSFGYIEVQRALGFLHISFSGRVGCLFKLEI